MAKRKNASAWEYGDFQTPPELAQKVCALLAGRGMAPGAVVEPTCGRGAFLEAAIMHFPDARHRLGVEINPAYAQEAQRRVGASAQIELGDFFALDWDARLTKDPGPWLVLGNPPWVTNADLGALKSANLPVKSNFQGHAGLDALTGKANFDISESMLLRGVEWLRNRSGWIAMLVKTSVARKLLRQVWRQAEPVGKAAIHRIDAQLHFGAAVDACLFILPVSVDGPRAQECDVFADLCATEPQSTIGFRNGILLSDLDAYLRHQDIIAKENRYVWRSGVKHDCSKVMELSRNDAGALINGLGEKVDIEPDIVFPLLKSSHVSKGRNRANRFIIVTQRRIGDETKHLEGMVPETWKYLIEHADKLDARGSIIYRGKPRFSMFGIGPYTFAPWKVAISGFYKPPSFMKIGPMDGRPVMVDDTVYFLPCRSEREADFIVELVRSDPFTEVLAAMVFNDEKRPITAELLKRVSLEKIADHLGLADDYASFTKQPHQPRLCFA